MQELVAQSTVGENDVFKWNIAPFYQHRKDGKPGRAMKIFLANDKANYPVKVTVKWKDLDETTIFDKPSGTDGMVVLLPDGVGVNERSTIPVTVEHGEKKITVDVTVPSKKQWTVFIYPHSHLDIGYTGLPEDVKKIQLRNIDVGIDIAEKTQHYPEGARFIWNPEATWVVKNYLEQATTKQKSKFIEAARKGWVRIDGGHSNSNTTTFSEEEMIHFFDNKPMIEKTTGVPIHSMVQVDLPGVAWGLVTIASQFGINRFVNFPNTFDMRKKWEHQPFYWLGPDGKTKMLFLQGYPYGIGYNIKGSKYGLAKIQTYTNEYDRVSTQSPMSFFLDPFIFEETNQLERKGSPYDLFAMTWSMADNCVIDADLPEAVKEWNNRYAYPKLQICGVKEILDAFEHKYAAIIPTYKGDISEFWTNGLGSDATSVAAGREGKEQLVQAETLAVMLHNKTDQSKKIDAAWEDQLLSAEHTWGAQNSESELARQVEKIKASYFTNAKQISEQLIAESLSASRDTTSKSFSIINTLSWDRSGIVTLTKAQTSSGNAIVDERNKSIISQRLSSGELIFEASGIPAFGSKLYRVVKSAATTPGKLKATTMTLSNELVSLTIDPKTGNINSLRNISTGYQYVDTSAMLNSYQYVKGVYNGQDRPMEPTTTSNVSVRIKENGPLLVSLLITSKAEGIKELSREIRLYRNSSTIEIINLFDKISTRRKEGIHFGFGFNIPNSKGHIEMPWSIVAPGIDQLPGSNKNWFTFERWVDISNDQYGVTWTALDSPLIEWGALSGNILDGARQTWLWQQSVPQSSTIYSWPINNHWDTNFPLEQGGLMQQRYAFTMHNGYDAVAATRFGMAANRPLIVVQSAKNVIPKQLVKISNPNLVVSTVKKMPDDKSILFRIRSISPRPEKLAMEWIAAKPRETVRMSGDEETVIETGGSFEVDPFGMINVRVMF